MIHTSNLDNNPTSILIQRQLNGEALHLQEELTYKIPANASDKSFALRVVFSQAKTSNRCYPLWQRRLGWGTRIR